MDTHTRALYYTLLAGLAFISTLLLLFIVSVVRAYRARVAEYHLRLVHEIQSIDRDRERIAADLHDDISGGLSAVGLYLQQALESGDSPPIQRAIDILRLQHIRVKEIAFNLAPRILHTHGLLACINDFVISVSNLQHCQVSFDGAIDDSKFAVSRSVHLYRAVKEVVTNALKHAKASTIAVTCSATTQHYRFMVTDNGQGFHLPATPEKGHGLFNIRARCELLHASLHIHTHPGEGTKVEIMVPRDELESE